MRGKHLKISVFSAVGLLFASTMFGQTLPQAIQMTKNEQFEKADKAFKSLIMAQPANGDNYFYEGENFLDWGRLDSAMAAYQKGINMNATDALNYVGVAKIKWYQGSAQEANDNFFKAKTISKSKDAKVFYKMAESYVNAPTKDYKTAIDLLNQAVLLDSKDPQVYIDLGDAQWGLDPSNASNAISQYEKALKIDPKSVIAILREGMIYQMAANYDLSFQYYQKANQVDSTFAPAYRQKAEMLYRAGRYDEAIVQYKKYLTLNDALSARVRYAEFLFLAKQYDATITEVQKIFAKDSSNVILYRVLSYSQYEKKDYVNGLNNITKFFNKVSKTDVKVISSDYTYYGNLLSKNKKDSVAAIMLTKGADMMIKANAPADAAKIYEQIGQIDYMDSKCADAITYYQKSVALKQANVNTYYYLGRSAYDCKKYMTADSAFKQVKTQRSDLLLGYQWTAYSEIAIDTAYTGSAMGACNDFLQKVGADTMKNKDAMVTVISYMAVCKVAKNDYEGAKPIWKRVQGLDPNNDAARKFFESVNRPKQTPKKPGVK